MHFEILVEDQSGKEALDILIPKIIGNSHTFRTHPYKGIGRIPKNLVNSKNTSKRILLDQLPRLLRGYGKTYKNNPADYSVSVILICDLDDKCMKIFRQELFNILNDCNPKPDAHFCIAIEEFEAWFFGDIQAIKQAYPKAKNNILDTYVNDSVCGTWERLADAVYNGGSTALSKKGWQAIGKEKKKWAQNISSKMDISNNVSPSFLYFREKLIGLVGKNT